MRRPLLVGTLAAVLLVTLLAACGGNGDDGGATTTTTAPATTTTDTSGDLVAQGKAIYTGKGLCTTCHANENIPGAVLELGPDHTNIATEAEGREAGLSVEEYLRNNMYEHINEQNDSLRAKRDAMLAALGDNFGDSARWVKPEGGLYVWLEMPEGTDLAALQEQSFQEGVGYYNGTMFSPEGRGANRARLCFGHPSPQTNYDGIAELARIFERHGVM